MSSDQYDIGKEPSIAINDKGVLIETHENRNDLAYHNVKVNNYQSRINFGDSKLIHDLGVSSRVAINNQNQIVEVHDAPRRDGVWFHLGIVGDSDPFVVWRLSERFKGALPGNPSVAINSKIAIVFQSYNKNLIYRIGKIKPSTGFAFGIDWGNDITHNVSAALGASVTVTENGDVIIAYEPFEEPDGLIYQVGNLSADLSNIVWNHSLHSGHGCQPSIASSIINNQVMVVEVYKTPGAFSSDLLYRVGQVGQGQYIEWGSFYQYDKGQKPSVAINNKGFVVEVHQDALKEKLWKNSGTLDIINKKIIWNI